MTKKAKILQTGPFANIFKTCDPKQFYGQTHLNERVKKLLKSIYFSQIGAVQKAWNNTCFIRTHIYSSFKISEIMTFPLNSRYIFTSAFKWGKSKTET